MKNLLFFKTFNKLRNEENIFNKIKNLNKLQSIFPIDVKKTKLNDDIKDKIFKEFRFKFISKTSTNQKIIKEIYNTYFQKMIINTYKDENKNISYVITEKDILDELYTFGLNF
jgi:hypothetical protein